jgi:hypothetical protein
MPWRRKWIDPTTFEGTEEEWSDVLAERAYQVWVSEVSEYYFPSISGLLGMKSLPLLEYKMLMP